MFALLWLRRLEIAVACLCLCSLIAIVFAGSIGRYIDQPVLWSDEVAQALFVWVSVLSADVALQRGGHFRIDMLTSIMPDRAQFLLELAIKILLAATLCLLIHYGFQLARMTAQRPLPMTGVSSSMAIGALPIGFSLMLITIIEQFVAQLRGRAVPKADNRDVL